MKKMLVLSLVLAAGIGLTGFRHRPAPPDLSTPQAVVQSFVTALSNNDAKGMVACVDGATDTAGLDLMFGPTAKRHEFVLSNIISSMDGDHCRVAANVQMQVPTGTSPNSPEVSVSGAEIFVLAKHGDEWKLVPDPALLDAMKESNGAGAGVQLQLRPIATMVMFAGANGEVVKVLQDAREQARAVSCLSNVKQINLGLMMYVQDYDEFYPRKSGDWTDLIYPYLKNRSVFTCPSDTAGAVSYSLNASLRGIPLSVIATPENTVMVYEGKNGKPNYRHNGKAAIGFADGHAKLMTQAETQSLVWAVKYTPPAPNPQRKKAAH